MLWPLLLYSFPHAPTDFQGRCTNHSQSMLIMEIKRISARFPSPRACPGKRAETFQTADQSRSAPFYPLRLALCEVHHAPASTALPHTTHCIPRACGLVVTLVDQHAEPTWVSLPPCLTPLAPYSSPCRLMCVRRPCAIPSSAPLSPPMLLLSPTHPQPLLENPMRRTRSRRGVQREQVCCQSMRHSSLSPHSKCENAPHECFTQPPHRALDRPNAHHTRLLS